ncbi:hypothetical protein IWW36_003351 [Coemansia brasiliensis]|uniref:HhH-GPD domain-containing protein n=1 Tax=Coemansia brasiliensis TaxID=2650707 RepID=A0A9W8IE71_9FUNG|nr:hypothetical protein IWW36_003351 [Coemansia brasiliensis]
MTTRKSTRLAAKAVLAKQLQPTGKIVKRSPKKRQKPVSTAKLPIYTTNNAAASTDTPNSRYKTLADAGEMEAALIHLKAADPALAVIIERTTEECSMSLPRDEDSDSSFVSLCKSVIFQQLAGSAARAILVKFLKKFGTLKDKSLAPLLEDDSSKQLTPAHFIFPSPQEVLSMDYAELKAVGLSQRKAEYLQAVAERFNNGTLSDELLVNMSDSQVSEALVSIRGIGQWTADMFMMFFLKRPNVLPTLDLAVRKAMCHHFKVPFGKRLPTHNQLVDLAHAWEPYRSVATWYMWRLAGTITQKD